MSKITLLIKKHKLLLGIVALGLFLRWYKPYELLMYGHDHDLASWVVRDIIENKHFRLIGQETSVSGVFIGALYYYLLIPFYALFGMDPKGGVYLSILIGVFSILSHYFVFTKIFNKKVGLIAATLFSSSATIVMTEREVVPTTPVFLWAVWFLYSLYLLLKGKQSEGLILAGFLGALIWHLNLGLILLLPLVILAMLLAGKRVKPNNILLGGLMFGIFSLPLFLFELRHGFIQTNAILASLTESSGGVGLISKIDRVLFLVSKNITNILWGNALPIPMEWTIYLATLLLIILIFKKAIQPKLVILFTSWIVIYIAFFSVNSIIVSEYYLNGMTPIWLALFSIGLYELHKKSRMLSIFLIGSLALININRFLTEPINKSGYVYRRAIVQEIKADAASRDYPCISISYITNPGYELGYRYLFYIEDMKVLRPDSLAPVYSIVFPHSLVDRIDKGIGALGLIYPDYPRYNLDEVREICEAENANVTEPLFGYTQ